MSLVLSNAFKGLLLSSYVNIKSSWAVKSLDDLINKPEVSSRAARRPDLGRIVRVWHICPALKINQVYELLLASGILKKMFGFKKKNFPLISIDVRNY